MKLRSNTKKDILMEGGLNMIREPRTHGKHILPHERKALMNIEFEESDWALLNKIFDDEDTAIAALEIIKEAPPEIQILAIQLLNIIDKEVA